MGKIKLNLASGAVVEKPLINAFKANNITYVVLDNEMNGSMGLPIILVCKLDNNKLVKIIDQNEWQSVKEFLKNIIAGNQMEFVSVNNEISADDIYYTQLTLPVPSFDALKNAYKIESKVENVNLNPIESGIANQNGDASVVASSTPEIQVAPVMDNSVSNVNEVNAEPIANQSMLENNVISSEQIVNEPKVTSVTEPVMMNSESVSSSPVMPDVSIMNMPGLNQDLNAPIEETITNPIAENSNETIDFNSILPNENKTIEEPIVNNQTIEPEITPTPVIDSPIVNETINEDIFKQQKEAFMQACENMFEALVQKFKKELENKEN